MYKHSLSNSLLFSYFRSSISHAVYSFIIARLHFGRFGSDANGTKSYSVNRLEYFKDLRGILSCVEKYASHTEISAMLCYTVKNDHVCYEENENIFFYLSAMPFQGLAYLQYLVLYSWSSNHSSQFVRHSWIVQHLRINLSILEGIQLKYMRKTKFAMKYQNSLAHFSVCKMRINVRSFWF